MQSEPIAVGKSETRENRRVGISAKGFQAPASARVGLVRLAVAELARSVEFYERVLGFAVLVRGSDWAQLGVAGEQRVLLELEQLATPRATQGAPRLGLFHVAYLLPSREDLSAFVRYAIALGLRIGAGDHIFSEAIYFEDPDGLGIEVYADRPRADWPVAERKLADGGAALEYAAATLPFRFNELPEVAEVAWQGVPAGTQVGHVHLSVDKLDEAVAFYHRGLGLDLMTWSFPGALFVAAGGYHHHVGLNVWHAGAPRADAGEPRLLEWTLVLPDEPVREAMASSMQRAGFLNEETQDKCFVDPYGTWVRLVTEE